MFILMPVPHCFDYYRFITSFEIEKCACQLWFFFKIVWTNLGEVLCGFTYESCAPSWINLLLNISLFYTIRNGTVFFTLGKNYPSCTQKVGAQFWWYLAYQANGSVLGPGYVVLLVPSGAGGHQVSLVVF